MTDQVPRQVAKANATDVTTAGIHPAATPPGSSTVGGPAVDLGGLRAAFPAWNVWRSDEGCWWATRSRPLPPSRWPGGYALTVTAGDLFGLREQLAAQPDQRGPDARQRAGRSRGR
jgi:hypothetical protein